MRTLWKDLRYGARMLRKQPAFTAVAILALSLGIGANTAIFSVINAVLLRPLPYAAPEQLAMVWESIPGNRENSVAPGNFGAWRDQSETFAEMAAYTGETFNLSGIGEPLKLEGLRASAKVKNSQFTDGLIDFDLAFTGERGFMGAAWRMQDVDNYEEFYIRPHQSGNPDANQYQPVFNGVAAWQLYYGEGYGAPVKYDFNQWIHIRIVVSGQRAEVYIKDLETPALVVSELKRETKSGKVGLSVGNFAPGYFSNFSFTPAVTENFGGWGINARWDNTNGIKLRE